MKSPWKKLGSRISLNTDDVGELVKERIPDADKISRTGYDIKLEWKENVYLINDKIEVKVRPGGKGIADAKHPLAQELRAILYGHWET